MHWRIVTVGKPSLPWARDASADYVQRVNRVSRLEIVHVRDGSPKQAEEQMLKAAQGCLCVALDERGKQRRSVEFAHWIRDRELDGTKRLCLLVGGSDGLPAAVRNAATEMWSLSEFTLQHELALVVLLEQIYRGYSILRGEPYHRE